LAKAALAGNKIKHFTIVDSFENCLSVCLRMGIGQKNKGTCNAIPGQR